MTAATTASSETETIELTLERTIPASAAEVFDAWLNPETPANPWHGAKKLILDPTTGALFYWQIVNGKGNDVAHYGMFTDVQRPSRIQHTWVSPGTKGVETVVTVTLTEKGGDTVFSLHHTGLPDEAAQKGHTTGWNMFLDRLSGAFAADAAKA
jgi:uncharacterized protein YndB with AHSA1/START domain